MKKSQKNQAIIISSDEEPKLVQQPQQRKRLIRNDFEQINEELKSTEIQLRKRKIIYDDEDEVQKQTSDETMEKKKKFKLIKKQEIIIQAAQQEATTCPICLSDLDRIQVVILECGHMFCQACVKTQCEKYQNNCPLCRKLYKNYTICIRGEDGEYLRGQLIKVKRKPKKQEYLDEDQSEEDQQFVQLSESSFGQDSQYDAGDSFIVADDECCEVCQGTEDMEAMLFCKKCSCVVRHSYCQATQPGRVLCFSCRTYQHR